MIIPININCNISLHSLSVGGAPPRDPQGHTLITEDGGYFRTFGFGIFSAYKQELERVGGFNTSIEGWGGEDVDLYDKVFF